MPMVRRDVEPETLGTLGTLGPVTESDVLGESPIEIMKISQFWRDSRRFFQEILGIFVD